MTFYLRLLVSFTIIGFANMPRSWDKMKKLTKWYPQIDHMLKMTQISQQDRDLEQYH